MLVQQKVDHSNNSSLFFCFYGGMDHSETLRRITNTAHGQPRVIIATPDQIFYSKFLFGILREFGVTFVYIDEAHVADAHAEFRTSYALLPQLLDTWRISYARECVLPRPL